MACVCNGLPPAIGTSQRIRVLTFYLCNISLITPYMDEIIYPRSPREVMCGWMHLPRFIDKIRLHLAGKLAPYYEANYCKGLDGLWLETSGVISEQFIEVVKRSVTDGEVCDWVLKNVKVPETAKMAHR